MESRKYSELNENGNTTYPNLGDTAIARLRKKFIGVKINRREKSKALYQ